MKNLKGKIAFITGSTRGIGKAIALELASQGATILLHGSKKSIISEQTFRQVSGISSKNKIYYADLENYNQIFSMAESIKKNFKKLDILINNAGITKGSTLLKMTNEEWESVIKINLNSIFYITKLLIPLVIKNEQGRVINISSIYGLVGEYGLSNYCASKAGVIGLTKALSKEMTKYNITVNAICPGLIDTDLIREIPEKYLEQRIQKIPLGRIGKKEEVAKLVAFICSDDADYITGQAISINGGMY